MGNGKTCKKGYTTDELKAAITGSYGNMSTIAERLECSWDTARRYICTDKDARAFLIGETERMLDTAEKVITDSLDSKDHSEQLQTAKWLLATKGGGRGYGTKKGEKVIQGVTDLMLSGF